MSQPRQSRQLFTPGVNRFISLVLALLVAPAAGAATITVDTNADEQNTNADCSLREAVINANNDNQSGATACAAGSGDDEIVFASGLAGQTIKLTKSGTAEDANANGDLDINDPESESLTVSGSTVGDPASIILDGNGDDRVLHAFSPLILQDITIRNGGGVAQGAGIKSSTGVALDLSGVVVSGNNAVGGSGPGTVGGGGLYAAGPVVLETTVISGNSVSSSFDPSGGGMLLASGSSSIDASLVSGNSASSTGSAIVNGGGMAVLGSTNVDVTNTTFTGNTVASGGPAVGAAIYLGGSASIALNNATITANATTSGTNANGGIWEDTTGSVKMSNTVLAGNTVPSGSTAQPPDCFGTINSTGYNIVGDARGCTFMAMSSDKVGDSSGSGAIDPMLAPLADNNGPTRTHALLTGSPAIDAGNPNPVMTDMPPACEPEDQRGVTRPQDGNLDGGAVCDVGAVEFDPNNQPPTVDNPIDDQSLQVGDDPLELELGSVFSDPDGDMLDIFVNVSNTGVVNFNLSGEALTLTPIAAGSTTVTITAEDPDGETVSDEFEVVVEAQSGSGPGPSTPGSSGGGGSGALGSIGLLLLILAGAWHGLRRRSTRLQPRQEI